MLSRLDETTLFYGAAALTAITDNAALTYLGSLVEGVSDDYKYCARGGRRGRRRPDRDRQRAQPGRLRDPQGPLRGPVDQRASGCSPPALLPTLVVVACFRGIRGQVGEIFDLALWASWFSQLDRSFLFLLILPFVVAAVGLWSSRRM